jgi:hypothetical protein
MMCDKCEMEREIRENPNGVFNLLAYVHSCGKENTYYAGDGILNPTWEIHLHPNQPERSKREDHEYIGYFPPPWNISEHPEKTEGWIAFQEAQRKDPKYYGCGALNTVETQ